MKNILLTLTFCLFFSCQLPASKSDEPIAGKIVKHIRENCSESKTCQLNLGEVTGFSWDKLYVFDMAVEQEVISKVIGEDFLFLSPYYSHKMFFAKDNKVVNFEQHIIPEVDSPFDDGDISFEIKDSENKYAVFDKNSLFEVERIKTKDGEFYQLNCINCT